MCSPLDIFLGFLAILFPPIAVWVKRGICSADSLINILLSILGYIPGLIHAFYIIGKYPDEDEYERVPQNDREGGRVTYVFVHGPPAQQGRPQYSKPDGQSNNNPNYGTASQPSGSQQQPQHQNAGEGSSDGAAPPSYAAVVAGDNKVQSHD